MIHDLATINWQEGLFIRPHHFQMADAALARRDGERASEAPYSWGISSLMVDEEALRGHRFRIHSGTLRLRDGTWLHIPGNAVASSKSFKEAFLDAPGPLPVWAGIRRAAPHLPSVGMPGEEEGGNLTPFLCREITVADENSGGDEQAIPVKLWNIKVFVGKRPGDAFEAIRIAEIVRSHQTGLPVLNPDHIPPLTRLGANPSLGQRIRNLAVHLGNQAAVLNREIAEKRNALSADPATGLSLLMRLQATAAFAPVLAELQRAEEIHPFRIYLELARLAGTLSPVAEGPLPEIPPYDHRRLSPVMERLLSGIWRMLEGGGVPEFAQRPFEIMGDRRICPIDREWLEGEFPAYMCIRTEAPESELDGILNDLRVKIGPASVIDTLLSERRRGLPCQRIRRAPEGLQDRSGHHYYRVDLSRTAPFADALRRDLILEIRGLPETVLPEMKLFVRTGTAATGDRDSGARAEAVSAAPSTAAAPLRQAISESQDLKGETP